MSDFEKSIQEIQRKLQQYARQGYVSDEFICDGVDLRKRAPNAIVWIADASYLHIPSIYKHVRQYQIVRDFFQLRCPICNRGSTDCWGKSEAELRREVLLEWDAAISDDRCPKCGLTRRELLDDEIVRPYDSLIGVAGMRSGKSVVAAMIGTYQRHVFTTMGIQDRGVLHSKFNVLATQSLEIAFVATTATQSSQTIWMNFREQCANSPWFKTYVRWVKAKEDQQLTPEGSRRWTYKELEDEIEDGYLMLHCVSLNSNSAGLAGRTRLAYFIDELSRFGLNESRLGADEVWAVFSRSLKTVRGARDMLGFSDSWIGTAVAISSPISISDKTMLLYEQGRTEKRTYRFLYPTWEFNPFQPRSSFEDDFKKDPVLAERDFGARPPNAASPLVQDPIRFWTSLDTTAKASATFRSTFPVDANGREYVGAELDYASMDRGRPLYIFGDAGLRFDQFALVACSSVWLPAFTEQTQEDRARAVERRHLGMDRPMEEERDLTLVTVHEWSLRIIPEAKKSVWFESVLTLLRELMKYRKIAMVAFDHWNSESTLQSLSFMGIGAQVVNLLIGDFTKAVQDAMLGRLRLLPPRVPGEIYLDQSGGMRVVASPDKLSPEAATLYELLRLERSEDLKTVGNPRKGKVRGHDSDDLAHCLVGAHRLVQESIGTIQARDKLKESRKAREVGGASKFVGSLARFSRW